jgi:hypothetical protein
MAMVHMSQSKRLLLVAAAFALAEAAAVAAWPGVSELAGGVEIDIAGVPDPMTKAIRHLQRECGVVIGYEVGVEPAGEAARFTLPLSCDVASLERAIHATAASFDATVEVRQESWGLSVIRRAPERLDWSPPLDVPIQPVEPELPSISTCLQAWQAAAARSGHEFIHLGTGFNNPQTPLTACFERETRPAREHLYGMLKAVGGGFSWEVHQRPGDPLYIMLTGSRGMPLYPTVESTAMDEADRVLQETSNRELERVRAERAAISAAKNAELRLKLQRELERRAAEGE